MRLSVLAALLALLLLAWPAEAQQPTGATPASNERVVLDAVFWAMPGPVHDTCLQFPPGHLAVTLHLEPVGDVQPVRFWCSPSWYRTADGGADSQANGTRDPSTFEATLAGGRYCYVLTIDPVAPSMVSEDAGSQAQLVAIRMTLRPE